MGIRQTINDHPAISGSIAGAVCLLVVALLFWENSGHRTTPLTQYANKAFYSDDDGQTWFIDDVSKLPPFDHNGKPACRAMLFRCGTGKPFVGYLAKYSDAELKEIATLTASLQQRTPGATPAFGGEPDFPMDVKKPGDTHWIPGTAATNPQQAAAYQHVVVPVCPDGNAITAVLPADADAH